MSDVKDQNFYPEPFRRFAVSSEDVNGNPLVTKFYDEDNNLVFTWTQTWNTDNKCTSWILTVA